MDPEGRFRVMSPDDHPGDRCDVTIRLAGLVVHTNHGVTDAEQELGQRMVFDIEMKPLSCNATRSDDVEETVDYGVVSDWVVEAAQARRYRTLERLVAVLADGLLDGFELQAVRVRATKPEPPVALTMDGASVEISLSRDN